MSNPNAIEVRVGEIQEQDGLYHIQLNYYMENNPQQKHWRKVPGAVVGQDKDAALAEAEAIANELSELDVKQMTASLKALVAANRMVKRKTEPRS